MVVFRHFAELTPNARSRSLSQNFHGSDKFGGDWDGGQLIFRLTQAPPPLWIDLVTNRGNGMSYYAIYPPEAIRFAGNKAYWGSSVGTAQEQINQFKQRATFANREYVRLPEAEAKQQEEKALQQLHDSVKAEEMRKQVAGGLKF